RRYGVALQKGKVVAMRSLGFSLVLGMTSQLLGVAPSEAAARQARPMMPSPRPVMMPSRVPMMPSLGPGMMMPQPRMFSAFPPVIGYSTASRMPYGGSGMRGMSSGGYGAYPMPYGGSGASQNPYGGSSSPSPYAPAQAGRPPGVPTPDDIEVSGPL